MRRLLFPTYRCKSTYDIPYKKLYDMGVRGVIFDIDNTLVQHNAPADDRARLLFARLRKMGIKTCIISNNKEPRVRTFAESVGSAYVYRAGKPLPGGYLRATDTMGVEAGQAVFVGDQIYTDIVGANLAGIRNILVRPLGREIEIQIKIKRILELPVLGLCRIFRGAQEL
jgi:uncharacterized protein